MYYQNYVFLHIDQKWVIKYIPQTSTFTYISESIVEIRDLRSLR